MTDGFAYPLTEAELAAMESRVASLASMTPREGSLWTTTGVLSAEILAAYYVNDMLRLLAEVRRLAR